MLQGRGLDLGVVTIRNGHLQGHPGFDGYHFGFVDQDGDGDGINDRTGRHYDMGYRMDSGFQGGGMDWPMHGGGMMT